MFADQFENLANLRAHYATGATAAIFHVVVSFRVPCHVCCTDGHTSAQRCPVISARLCSASTLLAPAGTEILAQTDGRLDAFVCGAGTGGTIAGVSHVLKRHDPGIQVLLVDPPGSSLYNKVRQAVYQLSDLRSPTVLLAAHVAGDGETLQSPWDNAEEAVHMQSDNAEGTLLCTVTESDCASGCAGHAGRVGCRGGGGEHAAAQTL